MRPVWQDIRLSFRLLRRAPLFAAVTIATLALAIGASTAVFAVADGAILRPFPYRDMARIVLLSERSSHNTPMSVSYPNFLDWRAQSRDLFEELGVYRTTSATMTDPDGSDRLNSAVMTASVYDTIGIEPMLGRRFRAADDAPGDLTVILSERVWRSRFGARADVVGSTVLLNGQAHTVVGVFPAAMRFPSRTTDLWLPFGSIVASLPPRGSHPALTGIARLKPGVPIETARASMRTIAARLAETYPTTNQGSTVDVASYYASVVGTARPALLAALGAVGLVLLIACANLGNMMLARGESRRQEMAVRAALGAGRGRLVQQLVTESFVLSAIGAAAGVALAVGLVKFFVASNPSTIPRIDLVAVDWRALAFAAALAGLTTVLVGLLPAFRSSRAGLGHGQRAVGGRSFLRGALVVAEMSLALVLLVGAGLLTKSFVTLMSRQLGYQPAEVITGRIALSDARYPTVEAWIGFHDTLIERLSHTPGVEAAGFSSALPLGGGAAESMCVKEGDPMPPQGPAVLASFQHVGGDYFRAMGTRIAAGRAFDARDTAASAPVIIIDDVGARKIFGDVNPIGRRVAFEQHGPAPNAPPVWREVVGVVPHITHYALTGEPEYPELFVPYTQLAVYVRDRRPAVAIAARVSGDPATAIGAIRQTLHALDPTVPLYSVRPLSGFVDDANETQRLGSLVFGAVSGLALLLAVLGIYGVLSFAVSQRTREIGVRVALGARRSAIVSMIAREAGLLIGAGLAIGTGGAAFFAAQLKSMLVGVTTSDPAVYASVIAALALTAGAAAAIPASRAARVDPAVTLRDS